jgi:LacI family transcriptional regulator
LVGIKEVAMRAGVGIGSVSRVFSGEAAVSERMRERVLKAAENLNYAPNMLAQSLRRRTTHSVGFVVSDIANPLVSSIIRGAEFVLSAADYSILLTNSGDQPSIDVKRIGLLQQRQVDGLILLPSSEDDSKLLSTLKSATVPIVIIDRSLPSDIKARYVLSDHYAGIGDATRKLLKLGHKRLAAIVGRNLRPSRERVRAISDSYADAKVKPNFTVHWGSLSVEHSAAVMTELLDGSDPPTAVILGGNQLLEGALAVIQARNLHLGRDLSLVCCDDVPLGRFFETPISTVMRDTDLMGQTAARLLLESMSGSRRSGRTVVLPTWFESRASCGMVKRRN